jgi:preprotein translocase subunit SecA
MGDDHIEHRMLSRGIENAQKRIESKNFDARKSLLEYDDVSNDQRQAIYSLRNQLLEEEDISETINNLIEDQFNIITNSFIPVESVESQWKTKDLENHLLDTYSLETNIAQKISEDKKLIPETIVSLIISMAKDKYAEKYKDIGDRRLMLEKQVMLQVLDVHWKEHLGEIDHLRNSIGLRAYAQKNPKNEFKKEAYSMFESMLDEIDGGTVRILFSLQIANEDDIKSIKQNEQKQEITLEKAESNSYNNDDLDSQSKISKVNTETIKRDEPKLGRNDLVRITNGQETQELKYKKAKLMIESGEWRIV